MASVTPMSRCSRYPSTPKRSMQTAWYSKGRVPTSALIHAERGGFYGHPDGLKWHPGFQHTTVTLEMLRQMRRPPAVYLPRGLMGTSPGQPVWDLTAGKFGPFVGQIFLGDVSALLMRVDLEKVAGAYQGAAFTFLRGQGLRIAGQCTHDDALKLSAGGWSAPLARRARSA